MAVKTDALLTAQDLADWLNRPVSWVHDMVQQRRLPFLRVGRHLRFKRSDIENYLTECQVPATGPLPIGRGTRTKRAS